MSHKSDPHGMAYVKNGEQQSDSQHQDAIHHVIEQLAHLGFQQNLWVERKGLHFPLIRQLIQVLRYNGYFVENDYPLHFFSHPRRYSLKHKPKPASWTTGQIDIMAFNRIHQIAIEFDTTNYLKWKSIEKLFHSPASHCVGMIFGSWKEAAKTFRGNVKRIKTVVGELKQLRSRIPTNEFWLILLKSKYVRQIVY